MRGALAARTRVDGNGAPRTRLLADSGEHVSQVYSVYAGPSVPRHGGDVEINANYRLGYTQVESPDAVIAARQAPRRSTCSTTAWCRAQARTSAMKPGHRASGRASASAAASTSEDISNLDQRVRDLHVRGDVHRAARPQPRRWSPGWVTRTSRFRRRDARARRRRRPGDRPRRPLVTDKSAPRQLAYDVSG